jgi:hypothetical protein
MAWENHERQDECFCGNGTITHRWRDGDWNGQYEDLGTTIDCPKCATAYEYKVVGFRSDDHSPRMAWVKIKK